MSPAIMHTKMMWRMYVTYLSFIFFFFFFYLSSAQNMMYNVQKFGAKADGRTDSTKAFLGAWAAVCNSTASATIYVPVGRYLLGAATFAGQKCKSKAITIRIDGTLVAPSNYNVIGSAGVWLKFHRVNGLSISGGTLDGQGTGLWACKNSGNKNCPNGATTLGIYNANNVVVSGLTSINSQKFHIIVHKCTNIKIQGVNIVAPDNSPNTDGIHVEYSSAVTILSSQIATGDDCISIGAGTSNFLAQSISCGPGHGISIGSLGKAVQEPGVDNIVVKQVTFKGSDNGFRIKTWSLPSDGFVRNVLFQQAVMVNVKNPILIDQYYCPGGTNCPNQVSGIKISGVTFQDIRGTSATPVAVKLKCSKEYSCSQITLQNVNLVFNNKPAIASCTNAGGSSYGVVNPSGCL